MKTTWSLSTALCCSGFTEGGACQISERWRGYNLKLFCIQRVGVGVPGASWVFSFVPSKLLVAATGHFDRFVWRMAVQYQSFRPVRGSVWANRDRQICACSSSTIGVELARLQGPGD